jgi:hypothetical protein
MIEVAQQAKRTSDLLPATYGRRVRDGRTESNGGVSPAQRMGVSRGASSGACLRWLLPLAPVSSLIEQCPMLNVSYEILDEPVPSVACADYKKR